MGGTVLFMVPSRINLATNMSYFGRVVWQEYIFCLTMHVYVVVFL